MCHYVLVLFPRLLSVALLLIMLTGMRAHALEKATIQLKWLHHFQFAGYYMALEKGFYREAGLDVTIREGGPTTEVEKDVASGRADFGTGTSALLLDLARGEDFVVLGQVFQHSPAVFLTPRKTGIRSVKEMAGRRFMYANQHGDMRALLKRYGVDEAQIVKVPHKGDPRELIRGKADVMLAYSFNEPYVLEQEGEPYLTFSPLAFGIDFYGDNFFATRRVLKDRPEFVKGFREATLRGWRYALEHKVETAEMIHAKYSPAMSREHLLFEAEQLEALIQPTLVELGYQSPSRWQRISETFSDLGMLPKGFDPSPIIYAPRPLGDYRPLVSVIMVSSAMICFLTWLTLTFRRLNINLNKQVEERKHAEELLQETRELFSLFMKHTPVYTYIKEVEEEQSRVILASDNFIDLVGISAEEMRGRTMNELFPAEFARKITADDLAVVGGGKFIQLDEDFNGRNYSTIKFPISRGAKGCLIAGFTMDITERKRAEEERQCLELQLLHAQKLEGLGVLAGGIAHDFNNILMAIIGNADLALMKLNPESPVVTNLNQIEQAASRAADLARQMLAYSGKGKFMIESVDLNRLLEEMLQMLEVSISKKSVLRLDLAPDLPTVEADATQIRQVIMNLVINASEAIGDKSGVISIATGCMKFDRNELKDVWLNDEISEGVYVCLEIEDTGCGMDKATISKIFDPFFTTKFTGRGLGMAAVLGIVRGHKGAIKLCSEPGKGTTFKVLLPAISSNSEIL